MTVASALIPARPERIWPYVADCANYMHHMPKVTKSSASDVQLQPNFGSGQMKCTVTADLPWPLSDLTGTTQVTLTVDKEKNVWRREWHLIEGDYHYQEGTWTLVPIDEGAATWVIYRLRAKPKIMLPDALVSGAQKRVIPEMMRRLRERATAP